MTTTRLEQRVARLEQAAGTGLGVVIAGVPGYDLLGETTEQSIERQCRERGISGAEVAVLVAFYGIDGG